MKNKPDMQSKLLASLLLKGSEVRKDQEILSSGSLIRLLRLELGMTQEQLAARAKMPRSTIVRIEKGITRPNVETLRKIFSAMECDIAYIPVPRFESIETLLREKALKLAENRIRYVEGTMALEKQRPEKKWRDQLLESEIESILNSPSQIWDEDAN